MKTRLSKSALRGLFLSALCAVGGISAAQAVPITMTHSATGTLTGTLDGTAFTTSEFTITALADTDDVTGIILPHLSATIEIDGVGTYTFLDQTRSFANAFGIIGFSRGLNGADLFNGPVDAQNIWDLMSDTARSGTGILFQWVSPPVQTSGGVLAFDFQIGVGAGFTAQLQPAAVPLPAGVVLLIGGLGALGVLRRRGGLS